MSNKDYYEFKSYFQIAPMVLYVGHNISEEALNVIMTQPWSCIITSRTDNTINDILKGSDQNTKEIINSDNCTLPLIKMGRNCLYLIKLFNTNSVEKSESEDAYVLLREFFQKYMRGSVRMTVVGYDDSAEDEVDLSHFAKLIKISSQNSIQFWMPHFSETVPAVFKEKHISVIDDTLEHLLSDDSSSELLQPNLSVSTSEIIHDTFYLDSTAVTISEEECYDLSRFSSTVTLLTENTVNKIMPNGLLSVQKWFFNFLNDSPLEGPQWYGYNKRTEYFVERSYELKLMSLINMMIAGKVHKHNLDYGPIILSGHSCSSKTITLCSLAYKYFIKRKSPVVYIKNNSITPYEGSDELKDIKNLLQYIETKMSEAETSSRILIFWDCSNFRDVEKNVRGLFNSLSSDGRRFILVCSSYPNPDERNTAKYYRDGIQVDPGEDFDYYRSGSCYYVCSDRQMNDIEIKRFWNIFREYSGLSNATINYWQNKLCGETDIFSYYYKMVSLLRKNLEQKLSIEEDAIKGYVEREFDAILNNYDRDEEKTEYQLLLEKYLSEMSDEDISLHEDDGNEESTENYGHIDRLLILVAMFSKYNFGLPYDIICSFIKQIHHSGQSSTVYFSTDDQQIFRALTKIPLFSYSTAGSNGFTFRFRNSLEAQVFLNRKDTDGSIQFALLLELIDLFVEEYMQTGEFDGDFGKCLRDYINLNGPNSLYYQSPDDFIEEDDSHEYFLNNIPVLLEKLLELLDDVDNLTASIGFAHTFVTFTREYYGNNERCADLTIEERLQHLENAIRFAKEKMDEIQIEIKGITTISGERYLTDEYHALATEYAFTYRKIRTLQKDSGIAFSKEQKYDNREFDSIYQYLREIIAQKPTNGYAYNALFSNFLLMYETEQSPKRKLEYLCKMLEIINDSNGLEIVKRGAERDYLSENITKIFECCDRVDISIDSITNRSIQTEPHMLEYMKMYDAWLEANNPIAIIFVCMKELKNADVMLFQPSKSAPNSLNNFSMTKAKANVCKKVISFMTASENFTSVRSNSFALELLIRTKWVLFNKKPLQGNLNRQMTSLTKEEWKQILELCDLYGKAAIKSDDNAKPVIMLIYALSKIQACEDYIGANRILQDISSNMRRFSNNERTRAPYMLCDEHGKPLEYTESKVYAITDSHEGYLQVSEIPLDMGAKHKGVYFKINNFGKKAHMPDVNQVLRYPIEISIGYIGLSAYTREGRIDWGDTV